MSGGGQSAEKTHAVTETVWAVKFPDDRSGTIAEHPEDFARRRAEEFPWLTLIRCERTTTTTVEQTPWEAVTPPGSTT